MSQQSRELMEEYHRYRRRKILFVILLSLAAVVTIGLSLTIGGRNLGFFETYQVLFSHIMGATYDPASDQWLDDYIVWNSRLPRAIFAVLAGATLAVCGAVMQGVLHNPLADSYTTGVSSGACFGVSVSVVLGLSVGGGGDIYSLGTLLNAFIFALIPIAFIVGLSPLLKKSSASLILAGIAVSYLFNAFNTLLLVLTDAESLADIYIWQVGSVSEIFWADLPLVVAVCIPCMICMALLSGKLNILNTGDDDARALGLNVDNLKTVTLSFSALAVAVVVCKAGILSFVGLICPHIIRMFIDADNRFVIPASAGLAGVLLLGAEMISRTISPSGTIPVGVVLSFIGAPVLLYLIVRRRSNIY